MCRATRGDRPACSSCHSKTWAENAHGLVLEIRPLFFHSSCFLISSFARLIRGTAQGT